MSATSSRPLARLRAETPAQGALAAACRAGMLREASERGDRHRLELLSRVADPVWFVVNRVRQYHRVEPPKPDQVDQPTEETCDAPSPTQ